MQVHVFGRPPVPRLVRPTTARALLGRSSGLGLGSGNRVEGLGSRSMYGAEMEGLLLLKRERVRVETDAAAKLLRQESVIVIMGPSLRFCSKFVITVHYKN